MSATTREIAYPYINVFAFSFSEVLRYHSFLKIIEDRYKAASHDFVANNEALQKAVLSGNQTLTEEQMFLLEQREGPHRLAASGDRKFLSICQDFAGQDCKVNRILFRHAEPFYRRLHLVELEAEAAKTEDQLAAAKLSFGVVWDALRSTPAGDGDVVLNGVRCAEKPERA